MTLINEIDQNTFSITSQDCEIAREINRDLGGDGYFESLVFRFEDGSSKVELNIRKSEAAFAEHAEQRAVTLSQSVADKINATFREIRRETEEDKEYVKPNDSAKFEKA